MAVFFVAVQNMLHINCCIGIVLIAVLVTGSIKKNIHCNGNNMEN